ncbi:MAG: protein kinase [Gemmataceae bacterium]|nr:protein kinase [Gemmataceae bacterium]
MPVRIEPNAEPIPGYRLIERLGGGGFGEVWKAEAPGGLLKAIKFVYGDLEAADDDDGVRASQELKALSRVKTVHHPYILSLERFDIIDGQLMIVMELADRTLWDRFRECRNQGLPGIPRPELLQYLHETAEALDLMNNQFQLQHLDIKPQNLFLVFNHVKVADFGLVKDLGNMGAATVTGGVTPVYAAPETFDGWLSRYSDQYSLAIVFQELLTGQRPFTGTTMRQLVLQHLQGDPDVSVLPAADRPIVLRALAKKPDDRFPTCLDFVHALERAGPARTTHAAVGPSPAESPAPPPPLADTQHVVDEPRERVGISQTQDLRGGRPRPEAPSNESNQVEDRPRVLPLRPRHDRSDQPPPVLQPPVTPDTHAHRPKPGAAPLAPVDSGNRGIVQPALIVGLGKLGLHTLLALRRTISHEFGHADALPHVRLVGIDTDPDAVQSAGKGEPHAALRPHELLLARLKRPSHYLQLRDRDGKLPTDSWLNNKLIYRMPKQPSSPGLRALGRLAFVDNYKLIAKRLEVELQACAAQDTLHEQVQQTDLGIRSAVPRVYVVTALGGATGSGMFLDTAYTLRRLLRQQGHARAEVVALLLLPAADHEGIRSATLAQTYAALAELKHYSSGAAVFSAVYDVGENGAAPPSLAEAGPPFDRCYFLNLSPDDSHHDVAGELTPTAAMAGHFLYVDVATPLGKSADAARQQQRRQAATAGQDADRRTRYQSFGFHRVVWPRRTLLEQAARRLCRRVVEHWMSKDTGSMVDAIAPWAEQQWDAAGLRPEDLITHHQEQCEQQLKQAPEKMIQGVLSPLTHVLTPPVATGEAPPPLNLAPVLGAMLSLEKLLGIPEACRDNNLAPVRESVLEKCLAEVSAQLTEKGDHHLTQLIVRLLEEPDYRLAGAEEGLRQFAELAERALRSQETLSKELEERSVSLYQRIQAILAAPPQQVAQSQSLWKLTFSRKSAGKQSSFGADLLELIRIYAKTRYQCLLLGRINKLYVSLRGHLNDQIREVGFCRQRLGELLGLLNDKPLASPPPLASFGKLLLPPGCTTIDDAVARLDDRLTREQIIAFDTLLQGVIRQQYKALLNVCLGPSNMVRTLAPLMLQEAETFLAPNFQGDCVTDLWTSAAGDLPDAICHEVAAAYDEAAPELGRTADGNQWAAVSVPSASAPAIKEALRQHHGHVQVIESDRKDELLFYREVQQLELHELTQFGAVAQEAYRQRCAVDPTALHIRCDVPAWQTNAD